jgi:hypothetical protein
MHGAPPARAAITLPRMQTNGRASGQTMNFEKLLAETRLDPVVLAKREGLGKRSLVRWMHRGKRGHLLESFLLGRRRWTTEQAWRRFIAKTSETESQRIVTLADAQDAIDSL